MVIASVLAAFGTKSVSQLGRTIIANHCYNSVSVFETSQILVLTSSWIFCWLLYDSWSDLDGSFEAVASLSMHGLLILDILTKACRQIFQ